MNIEFAFTIIVSFLILYIGVVTFFHDRKNITNKILFYISIITVFWAFSNYFSLKPVIYPAVFWSRLVLFFAVPHIYLFFLFIKNFPNSKLSLNKKKFYLLSCITLVVMLLTLSSYVFKDIVYNNGIPNPIPGIAMPVFAIVILSFLVFSIGGMVKKYYYADPSEKKSWGAMLFGFTFSYVSLIITNFILVNTTGDTRFILVAPLLMLPSILGIVYSIKKYRLFNVKAFATELIIFVLLSFSLIQIILSESTIQFVSNLSIFGIFMVVGILLIKSVYSEVEHRERLEVLRIRLEESNFNMEMANDKLKDLDRLKSEFVSLASHQLRSPLTAIKGYASMLLDGDYGEINKEAKDTIERIMESSNNLSLLVEDFLDVAKIEQGGMQYQKTEFDFGELVRNTIKDLSITAENKGLKLSSETSADKKYIIYGDKEKIRQILVNLVDNSMKYTLKGKVEVELHHKDGKILLSIKDTGMGISKETVGSIFEKFNRGDGAKMNIGGSGLGLYLVKEIIEAHNGRVWAESEGLGKGSTFFVEFDESTKTS